jgi:alanyl-tRNA synthetase
VGDTGTITGGGNVWHVVNTQKAGNTWIHFISEEDAPAIGTEVQVSVDPQRRNAIQRHHTVTHLFHWALHEVVSKEALQKGSYVGPDKLTFDFNSAPLTPQQVRDIERLVNERVVENGIVSWTEIPYAEAKGRGDITHLFGEKYGDRVRVVQIGGEAEKLNGYSMELCGGTHTRGTGEIGYFRITGESAIAAGVRRVEAVAGLEAYDRALHDAMTIQTVAGKLNAPVAEVEKKIDSLLAHQKELEKQLAALRQKQAAATARTLLGKATAAGKTPALIENLGLASGDELQGIIDALKGEFKGVIVLAGSENGVVSLAASVSPDFAKQIQAGKIIQAIAPIVGGKGGGRPEFARGAGKDAGRIHEALQRAAAMVAAV